LKSDELSPDKIISGAKKMPGAPKTSLFNLTYGYLPYIAEVGSQAIIKRHKFSRRFPKTERDIETKAKR
jgi:hypothetical protein